MIERFNSFSLTETKIVVSLVSISHFVNHMYIVLFPPILLILSEDFGVTLTALGIAMGVQGLVNTSLQLPFGYLSDNYSRAWTLAASLTFGSLGVLTVALAESYAWLLVGQAILGIGISAHHPAHYPLLADSTPESLRGRVYSVHGFAGSLGFATPPVLITAIISFEGLTWRHAVGFIGLIGAVYAVIAIIVLYRYVGENITLPSISEGTQRQLSVRERIRQELRSVVSSPPILALGLITFLTSTASWGITSYLVVLLNRGYGVPQDIANLTLTGMFVASAIMILVGGELTDRISAGPVMITSYSLVAVMVLVFGSLSVPAMVAVGVALLIGGTRSISGPARSKLTDSLSSRTDLGKNFAVITVGIMLGSAVAPPFFGALIENVGLRLAFFTIAGIVGTAALVTFGIVRIYADGFDTSISVQPGDD